MTSTKKKTQSLRSTSASKATKVGGARNEPKRVVQPRGSAVVDKILTGGIDVFLAHGFAGTSVDTIAQVTRTSKATIYRYFPDKEQLFTAIVDRAIEMGRRFPKIDATRYSDVRALIRAYAGLWMQQALSAHQLRLCRVYIFEIQQFSMIEKLFSRFDDRDNRAYSTQIADVILSRLKNVTDPERAAQTFFLLVLNPFLHTALFRPRNFSDADERRKELDALIEEFLKIYPPA